jgi:arginyl-tRNA synthetase
MLREEIIEIIKKASAVGGAPIELTVPEGPAFGHYATNVAMRHAKARGVKPMALAEEIAAAVLANAAAGFFEKVEAAPPGFVNFWLSKKTIQEVFHKIAANESFGANVTMKGKMVMVEYTDPNPFKLFHIGHLMTNTIGESFARLYEATGATVRRANYYGDVGLHIAKAVWGMMHLPSETPGENEGLVTKMDFLGKAYVFGSNAYEEKPETKEEIVAINKKIYERSDAAVNERYDLGLAWSLAYFETIYERLGTTFDDYFPESTIGGKGLALVRAHMDVFKESDGAVVFPGEQYGLHTRVFINSQGLPTYEAKELGLNQKKFERYPLDLSIIVAANEINEYFNVLLKAMELTLPKVAAKTRHAGHGMLRFASGKMSSRSGNVLPAETLIDQAKVKIEERMKDIAGMDAAERDKIAEAIAIGALKYSILKQSPGQDIIFDFEKSLSFEGDSGPYIQYTYARLRSIVRKSREPRAESQEESRADITMLDSENELALIRKMFEFPEIVKRAQDALASSGIVAYVYQFAALTNKFYETTPILKDDNVSRRDARLALVETCARILKSGLNLLGIQAPEKI